MIDRIPLSPDEHLDTASDALRIAGIPHAREDLQYVVDAGAVIGCGVDGGRQDVKVSSQRDDYGVTSDGRREYLYRESIGPFHSSNGELVNDSIRVEGGLARPGSDPLYYESKISAHSTPEQLTNVERALGQRPGVDAFRYVMEPGAGEIPLGVWVPPFADRTILVADPVRDWDTAAHDLELGGHVRAWRVSDGEFCHSIARKGIELMAVHGDSVFLPKGQRPEAVDRYADALELLPIFTDPVVGKVWEVTKAAERGDPKALAASLESMGTVLNPEVLHEIWWGDRDKLPELHERMQALGLVHGEADPSRIRNDLAGLAANRLGRVATMQERTDELWPRKDETPDQQQARKVALQHLGKTAAIVQERGVENSRDVLLSLSPGRAGVTAEQLLELADSRTVPAPDTYMTTPYARTQDEAVRDRTLPELGLDQALTVEPTPSSVEVPAPLTKSPLEIMLDQTLSQGKPAADQAAQQREQELRQQQALALEQDQNSRDRN